MKGESFAVLACAALAGVLGCTASQKSSPTAPGDAAAGASPGSGACTVSFADAPGAFNASGGNASAIVNTPANCRWSATTGVNSWIKIGARTFTGPAMIPLTIEPNRSFTGRSGAIEIDAEGGGSSATQAITQRGAGCLYSVDPQKVTRPWLGTSDGSDVGALAAHVHAEPANCRWTVTSSVPWMYLTLGSRPEGTGDATIYIAVLWNSAPSPRLGEVVIAGLSGVNPDAHMTLKQSGR